MIINILMCRGQVGFPMPLRTLHVSAFLTLRSFSVELTQSAQVCNVTDLLRVVPSIVARGGYYRL